MLQLRFFALCLALSMVAACGGSDGGSDDSRLTIVATTSMLGDVVRNIVGDDATVEVIIDGSDPHDFQPSSQQIAAIVNADLVIANGLGLEVGLTDALETATADGVNVFEVAPELEPLPFEGTDHDDEGHDEDEDQDEDTDHDDDHEYSSLDPHVWLDPIRMTAAAGMIAERIALIDDSVDWVANAVAYGEDLMKAHREVASTLASIPPEARKLITNHDAFGYFADRYGFEVVATVIPGGGTAGIPSSADLAALTATLQEQGVDVIVVSSTDDASLAETIADEVGQVRIIELVSDSIGAPGEGADTLIDMMLTNARRLSEALA